MRDGFKDTHWAWSRARGGIGANVGDAMTVVYQDPTVVVDVFQTDTGWYWQENAPGQLPDAPAVGPFRDKASATHNACAELYDPQPNSLPDNEGEKGEGNDSTGD